MNRLRVLLCALVLTAVGLGCGGDAQKGIYKDKDKPVPADKKGGKE